MRNPYENTTINGIVSTLKRLITAVSEIESATSPRPNAVSRLEVTPPGAAAMIMTPSAISGGTGQIVTRMNATRGNRTTWETAPTRKSFGWRATRAKSLTASPSPSVNMMNASVSGRTTLTTIPMAMTYRGSMT